ncbi:MAG: ABC transporter permease [Gemmatimonadaceae bacterium]
MDAVLVPFLEATIRTATPLAFAALGELVAERAGVINLGLEGTIVVGCLGAAVGAAAGGVGLGFAGAAGAGLAMSALFAYFVVALRTDQIITGAAFTMLGLGLTGTIARSYFGIGDAATSIPTIGPVSVPVLASMPLLGAPLFRQPVVTYLLYAAVPILAWWMARTRGGLALRAVGESPAAAAAAGIPTVAVRWGAILFSGLMGGLCGGTLVLAQVGSFNEGMSAGRGFIAIAVVVLGRWSPFGTAGAALLFGGAFALQYLFQALALDLPYQLFLALPYVMTLVLLAALRGRAAAPENLGR